MTYKYKGYTIEAEYVERCDEWVYHVKKDNKPIKSSFESLRGAKCFITRLVYKEQDKE